MLVADRNQGSKPRELPWELQTREQMVTKKVY